MKNLIQITIIVTIGMFLHSYGYTQESTAKIIINDSLKSAIDLEGVIIIGDSTSSKTEDFKSVEGQRTDEIIEDLQGVNIIRRGNYAAEPTFRGMSSGQLSMTIDGMKIFGACTDKMDPVSSYVSSNNLESITVSSNNNHACQGSNIGGGFDFQTKQAQFNSHKEISGSAGIGYQTNGNGRLADFNVNYGDSAWALNLNANYQKFDNYKAGGGQTIKYTQFEKVNFALSSNWMPSNTEILKAQFIYDDAYNVGYPALPMDVSFAGGRIYSLSYKKYFTNSTLFLKAYGNNITHIMDDTKREFVPMHMDMPGKSDTYGVFAKSEFNIGERHQILINPDYYYNVSFADMKMYPNDPNRPEEPVMYMITWPDVRRHSGSLLIQDRFTINSQTELKYSGKIEYVTSKIFSEFGIQQLEVIGKDGNIPSTYILGNGNAVLTYQMNKSTQLFGQIGYAERQPTVSEGFGYYLFNSMDGYDYIGIPDLRKETALKTSIGFNWQKDKTVLETKIYHYQFQDYIIGIVDSTYDGMTIGSNGVKVYENIPSASISGFEVKLNTTLFKTVRFQNQTQFTYGIDHQNNPLQMIPPLQNASKFGYSYKQVKIQLEAVIAAMQNNPRIDAGETTTPSYGIINISGQAPIKLLQQSTSISVSINNLFDSNYWDHLDWNSIPRPGRSFIVNLRMRF
ncbi:TonB-dependent receptor [bacterium SCSIO 12643]|nr:TonB-dependent receptor [bacterium SCSIO 12643]